MAALVGAAVGATVMYRTRYDTESARRGDIVEAVYGIGTVTTEKTFTARAPIPVRIVKVYVVEGAEVLADDPLLRLDSGATIRAPISGKLTQLLVHKGETVAPSQALLEVQDLSSRYVRLLLDQESALRVLPGQQVKFAFESLRGNRYDGEVKFVYPSSGRFVVRIDSDALPPEILPGMAADVAIEVNRRKNGLLVPIATIRDGVVQVLREGRRQKIQVKVGAVEGNWVEILEGDIRMDDELIVGRSRR